MNLITVIGEINAATYQQYVESSCRVTRSADVLISSPGGEIGYVLAMLDDIDYFKRKTYATGIVQSAAAVLATAGEGKRVASMDALFRFVPPAAEELIDPVTNEKITKVSDLRYYLHSILVARLAQRLKTVIPEIELLFDGKFISSIRAKELGLIDEVISTEATDGDPA